MALVGAFLIHLTLGSLHAFGNIAPSIIAYMRLLQPSTTIRYHDGLVLYVSAVLVQGIAGFFGGRLHRALGPTKATLLGGSVMSIGLVMSALTLHSCFLFCLSFGVVTAIGSGLCYPVPLTCALEWQPDRKGTVSCVIFLGRSLSVCLLCPIHSLLLFRNTQHSLLSFVSPGGAEDGLAVPEVYVSDTAVLQRLPALFLLMAGACLALQALGAALLSDPPPLPMDSHERRKLIEEIRSPSPATAASLLSSFVLTPQDLCSSSSFWLLFMMLFFSWQSVLVAAYMWKIVPFVFIHHASVSSYVDTPDLNVAPTLTDGLQSWQSVTDLHLSTIGAVAGALCVAGRLVWGYVGNKAGNKRALIIMNLCMAALLVTFMSRSMASPRDFALWLALLNACHGGLFSVLPSLTSDLFGHKNFGPVFSLLFAARLCAAACICVVLELADGVTLCMTLAGCHVLCAGLALAFHPTEALPNPYKLVMT
ncbi:Protein with signal peptide plus 12 transmembrane domain domain protein, possible tranporter, related [Eimeria necatrix]|uniref:Protein with signal peptide plus 12 transmembrane domain domain protein, possible tranporter, related n=1 Tax=Eimeria necatrix TaxID=51315 RepID=U6N3W7_9EIME|nr:Protein with signal peptide plus 12 transmembrane domain domain protein, possible tranporter, related [Eimeria necatrix]CDJ68610.1 Protein with signal peptide plus 12 transmembrane domain domain protein, possible tranporter, related [Eimeria necatrix]